MSTTVIPSPRWVRVRVIPSPRWVRVRVIPSPRWVRVRVIPSPRWRWTEHEDMLNLNGMYNEFH